MKKITWLFDTGEEAAAFAEGAEYVQELAPFRSLLTICRTCDREVALIDDAVYTNSSEVRDRTTGDGPTNLGHATTGDKR